LTFAASHWAAFFMMSLPSQSILSE
jgi:hypothetical protein